MTDQEATPETLSPLCKSLFDYMSHLDHEGLNWDEKEALEALAPVIELEQARQRAETMARNYLTSNTKALAGDDPKGTCAANHRGAIACAEAVLAALAPDDSGGAG